MGCNCRNQSCPSLNTCKRYGEGVSYGNFGLTPEDAKEGRLKCQFHIERDNVVAEKMEVQGAD